LAHLCNQRLRFKGAFRAHGGGDVVYRTGVMAISQAGRGVAAVWVVDK
jgi:hypothetical protein